MFNVLTIAREYGSGGAAIGRMVAVRLGWQFVDKQIISQAAAMGKVDLAWAEEVDEQSSTWWEHVLEGFRYGAPEGFASNSPDIVEDRERLQQFTARVIEEASKQGNWVIIGRGSQCVLHNESRALHVMVYAPLAEKLERTRLRHPHEHDLPTLLHHMDEERAHYIKDYYGCDWSDREFYQLCVNSTLGLDDCAKLIMNAIHSSEMAIEG